MIDAAKDRAVEEFIRSHSRDFLIGYFTAQRIARGEDPVDAEANATLLVDIGKRIASEIAQ
jgi:hypothetical protein